MRNILTSTIIATALFTVTVPAQAGAQTISKAQITKLVELLELSDTQKASAKPIITAGLQERSFILKSAGMEKGKKPTMRQLLKVRSPIKASRAKTETKLSMVLNPQQMSKYRAITEEARKKMRSKFN